MFCSLQFHITSKASLRAQVAEDELNVSLPRDEALNKQILRQIIRVNLFRLRSTQASQYCVHS